jgi:hypothetical protein
MELLGVNMELLGVNMELLGVNMELLCRGEHGTSRCEHALLFRRMKGRTEGHLVGNFTPGGQSLPLRARLKTSLW